MGVFKRLSRMLSNICKECCLTLEKGVFNVWKRYYLTFEKDVVQRLTEVLSNVWQRCYPTLDKGVIQRLTIILSRFEKALINISKFNWNIDTHDWLCRSILITDGNPRGWSVVEVWSKTRNLRFRPQLKDLNHCTLDGVCGRVVEIS